MPCLCRRFLVVKMKNQHTIKKMEKTTKKQRSIRVVKCNAYGPQFTNLTPGSIHVVINPPIGEKNKGGVWVMGNGEPVKLLSGEFEYV